MLSNQPLLFESLLGRSEEFFRPGLDWNFLLPNDRVRFRQFNECKVAIRFLAGDTSIEETTRDLTGIADAVVREIIEGPHDEFSDALREFCIVGLGKYGGKEMMVGSDLDLMVLYRQAGGPPENNNEKVVTQFLSKFKTDGGGVYVVDLRLRPEGRNAPLAVEFSYYEGYLVGRAEVWEKQALLKARVVYSSNSLEGMFTSLRRSVLSNVSGQEQWVEEIRRMREKMDLERTKEGSRTKDLKVGTGGLVDLEFAIQCLQLKNIANEQSIDAGNSFDAIRQLGTLNLLGKKGLIAIGRNYAFLRQLELLIRLNSESNDFVIPADGIALKALAAGMGITSVGRFLANVERVRIENRGLLKRVFAMMDK